MLSSVGDPGKGSGWRPPPPLFLDQNEARRAGKKIFESVKTLHDGYSRDIGWLQHSLGVGKFWQESFAVSEAP